MTDIPKLSHINVARQAEKTVAAHEAVHEAIAGYAAAEQVRRRAEDDKKRADGYLISPTATPGA